jgi:hypothetical protein
MLLKFGFPKNWDFLKPVFGYENRFKTSFRFRFFIQNSTKKKSSLQEKKTIISYKRSDYCLNLPEN